MNIFNMEINILKESIYLMLYNSTICGLDGLHSTQISALSMTCIYILYHYERIKEKEQSWWYLYAELSKKWYQNILIIIMYVY